MTSRSYDSPLRTEQLERTRQRIVEAAAEVMASDGYEELTVPRVAEKAGVAVRTVYRHFAGKEDLADAIGYLLDERFGSVEFADTVAGIVDRVPRVFQGFEDNAALVRATLASPRARRVIGGRRETRHEGLERAVGQLAPGLSPEQRRARAAALYALCGMNGWHTFHEQFGVGAEHASEASQWALRALLAALENEGSA